MARVYIRYYSSLTYIELRHIGLQAGRWLRVVISYLLNSIGYILFVFISKLRSYALSENEYERVKKWTAFQMRSSVILSFAFAVIGLPIFYFFGPSAFDTLFYMLAILVLINIVLFVSRDVIVFVRQIIWFTPLIFLKVLWQSHKAAISQMSVYQLFGSSYFSSTLLAVILIVLAYILSMFARHSVFLWLAIAIFSWEVKLIMIFLRIPKVLFLGTSERDTISTQIIVQHRFSPFLVASLLNRQSYFKQSSFLTLELPDFRDVDPEAWRVKVQHLCFLCEIIIIDARFISPFLKEEVNWILDDFNKQLHNVHEQFGDRINKRKKTSIILLVNDDISSPFFEISGFWPRTISLSEFTLIDFVVKGEFVKFLECRIPVYFPRALTLYGLDIIDQTEDSDDKQMSLLGAGEPLDYFPYAGLVRYCAKHKVIYRAAIVFVLLRSIETHGVPDNHEIMIKVSTQHAGAIVPDELRRIQPAEMWISFCNGDFKDLAINEEESIFSVSTYRFGRWWPIVMPATAILAFYDASVDFSLICAEGVTGGVVPYDVAFQGAASADREEKLDCIRRILKAVYKYGFNTNTVIEIEFRVDMKGAYIADDVKKLLGDLSNIFLSRQILLDKHEVRNFEVQDDYISFILRVDGIYRIIRIPFDCMTCFLDHEAHYLLQLED